MSCGKAKPQIPLIRPIRARFAVEVGGYTGAVAEITRGPLIGEIAFFAAAIERQLSGLSETE